MKNRKGILNAEVALLVLLVSGLVLGCGGCAGGGNGQGKLGQKEREAGQAGEGGTEKGGAEECEIREEEAREGEADGGRKGKTGEATAGKRGWFPEPELVREESLEFCEEYGALVEGYVDGGSFVLTEDEGAEELKEMLLGHYEVAGRRNEEGREYYLAVRRKDGPEYEDFESLSIGSVNDVCQIGYTRRVKEELPGENFEEQLLYEIPGWKVVIPAMDSFQSEISLEVLCFLPEREEDPAFSRAFTEAGRKELEFMRKHKGLSFYEEGKACIDFLYQDEDTVAFWSEPYPCRLDLSEEEVLQLNRMLEETSEEKGSRIPFENYGEALAQVRKEESSIRTTGASFFLEGRRYELLGCREREGYLLVWEEKETGEKELWLEENPEAWEYVRDRIRKVTERDYGDFTDSWFEIPLAKASLRFPRWKKTEDGSIEWETYVQVVEEPEKLAELSGLLEKAISGPEMIGACPYTGILDLCREDGETLQMFVASDSCDSIAYEGRIGFGYGRQEWLAEIFDEAMKGQ